MQTEIIALTVLRGKLKHYTSKESKEIDIDKKNFFTEALTYVENYITKNNFRIINATSGEEGMIYFITKP